MFTLFQFRADFNAGRSMGQDGNFGQTLAKMVCKRLTDEACIAFGIRPEPIEVGKRKCVVGQLVGIFEDSDDVRLVIPPQSALISVRNKSLPGLVGYTGHDIRSIVGMLKLFGEPVINTDEIEAKRILRPVFFNEERSGNCVYIKHGKHYETFEPQMQV